MKVLISGGAKNGKSHFAQDLTLRLAGEGKRYYIATMIPMDGEDRDRIRRHVADRAGLGFETIECGKFLLDCLNQADPQGAFLVDSATALLQNAMFPAERGYQLDLEAAARCGQELVEFAGRVGHVVFVSDYIYSDDGRYDPETEAYRRCLAGIDRNLARVCDTVIEAAGGQIFIHKGGLPE